MGRIRTVKPELYRHKKLFEKEKETGLPLRLAWTGLFTVCDREGRFKWDADTIKLDVLPWDDLNFEDVLNAFWQMGMVIKYKSGDLVCGLIPTFKEHQVINHREQASKIPSLQDSEVILDLPLRPQEGNAHACPGVPGTAQGEGKGREGKGKERETQQEVSAEPSNPKPEHPFTSSPPDPIVEHPVHEQLCSIEFSEKIMPKVPIKIQTEWLALYPDPAFWQETIREIHAWLVANPSRAWKNYPRGMATWLRSAWFKWERRPGNWQERNRKRIMDMKNPFEDQPS